MWVLTSNCFEDVVTTLWRKNLNPAVTGAAEKATLQNISKEVVLKFGSADYVCPGPPPRANPFASRAFLDRVQDDVLVFAPPSERDREHIAELELVRHTHTHTHIYIYIHTTHTYVSLHANLFAQCLGARSRKVSHSSQYLSRVVTTCSSIFCVTCFRHFVAQLRAFSSFASQAYR